MRLPDYDAPGALSERLGRVCDRHGQDHMARADMTETMRYYYAQIEWGVDKQVGRILSALEQQGLARTRSCYSRPTTGDFMGTHRHGSQGHVPLRFAAACSDDLVGAGTSCQGESDQRYCSRYRHFPNAGGRQRRQPSQDLPGRSLTPFLHGEKDRRPARCLHISRLRRSGTGTKNLTLTPADKDAVPRHRK